MDSKDMQNAAMAGVSFYLEWRRTFLSDFQESMMKGQIKQAFSMMPPQMKGWLKANDPKGYAQVMSMLEGDKNAY